MDGKATGRCHDGAMADGFLSRVLRRLSNTDHLAGPRTGGSRQGQRRVTGPPTSSNGASSFHLSWEVPPEPLTEVRADLEIVERPSVAQLYFWALQVNFVDRANGGVGRGGAHAGLQHHPAYPEHGAVNWGGYHNGGGELDGTESDLPSALNNVNTRNYRWAAGVPYRIRVFNHAPGRWRATVTDLSSGVETTIRDLLVDADSLVSPMVWSEVFADCDHPRCTVRWSNLEADLAKGGTVRARSVRLNYQRHADGGCANTNTSVDGPGNGFLQQTSTERVTPTGATLTLT